MLTRMQNAYLEIKEPKGTRQVPLDSGPLTIGRNFTNLLVIDEPLASRFHCVIEQDSDGFHVRDLESRNGTLVNGKGLRGQGVLAGMYSLLELTGLKLLAIPVVNAFCAVRNPGLPGVG